MSDANLANESRIIWVGRQVEKGGKAVGGDAVHGGYEGAIPIFPGRVWVVKGEVI